MYKKWGPEGSGEYVPVCRQILAYQTPLQNSRHDSCWGKIDLLGVGKDCLPVPNELKKRRTNESPLRMVVEVAAYGFAILKTWKSSRSTLKEEWDDATCKLCPELFPRQFPSVLKRLDLICVGPEEYWSRCRGTKAGAFPKEAWPPLWKLVDRLKPWFDIHFVAVEGPWDDKVKQPTITGARVLELRSLTLNPGDISESAGASSSEP